MQCRWLNLLLALERILEQWEGLKEYFLTYFPKKQPDACNVDRYKRLSQFFSFAASKPRIRFLNSSALLFQGFVALFQKEGPLIHLFYNKLVELYKQILMKYIKEDCWIDENSKHLLNENVRKLENDLGDDKIDIGYEIK